MSARSRTLLNTNCKEASDSTRAVRVEGRALRSGTLQMHEGQLRLRRLGFRLAESAFRKPRNKHDADENVGMYLSERVVFESRRRDGTVVSKLTYTKRFSEYELD